MSSGDDISDDRAHSLLQRLNDISTRLLEPSVLEHATAEALHLKMDEMMSLLDDGDTEKRPDFAQISTAQSTSLGMQGSAEQDPEDRRRENVSQVEILGLLPRMSAIVEELQQRNDEFKHLHDIYVLKSEQSARRILNLEGEVLELENEIVADEAELTFLKVQLKALEVQASEVLPESGDTGLIEGIKRWKQDWADVDHRLRSPRKAEHGTNGHGSPYTERREVASDP
ncbi:MAG: hypothetical protein M1825_000703 [Sarcosagium campestre]|nr:MAG: hypothetical protein M1825_000703 [Sarcosagium campestre]